MIKVVDFGSQLTQNIARRIREFGVYTEIVPFHTSADKVLEDDLEGIILSGGQFSVYDSEAPKCSKEIFELGVPVLGICYGLQLLTEIFGGKISSAENREYGEARIDVLKDNRLLIPGINETNLKVWMSHGDIVNEPPPDYEVIARSDKGHIAGLRNGDIYAVQFHPEVDHTDHGRQILNNFIEICGADKTWDPSQDYDRIVRDVSERLRGRVGVGGISGGVDSSSVSVLVNKIVGQDYHPIFVDNGLLRLDEAAEVMRSLESYGLGINLVDAGERFLLKLEGVSDPDEKRRIIGHEFIDVFQEQARKIEGASYLVQGTLYPDVIESVPLYEKSSV
ncbi:GMP synthase (glutamine-hydrolyzing), partial [Candidatus Pacearchaeota archaeon]|nr:GMP synthase (glutamine-hydrolyzing) [Candidatus Pacearchaeota archaeon]